MGEDIAYLEKKIADQPNTTVEEIIEHENNNKTLLHFVLIHGICHGAWCWYKIKCLLEISGYKVSCPDLKGCGVDQSDANKILSFDDYNKPLVDFLNSLPDDEQVILVGHSAGGLSVTDACHRFGKMKKKIRLAVYIGATMLKTGFITQQDVIDGVPDFSDLGELSDIYDIGFGLGPENPPTSLIVKKHLQRKLFYQMCPLEDMTLASILLRPGPVQALQSARFKESNNDIDKVPRVFIKTTKDRVIKPEQQENMIKKWQPSKVCVIESDHSPFFSAPFVLAGLLVQAASSFGCSEIKGNM